MLCDNKQIICMTSLTVFDIIGVARHNRSYVTSAYFYDNVGTDNYMGLLTK